MEPVEYARLLRRRWRVVVACVLVAAVAAWITTPATPTDPIVDWEATTTLVRDADATGAPTAIATVGLFVTTGDVPRLVAEEIGFDGEPAVLARRVQATPDELVGTLGITATARSPEAAADLANLWAAQTLSYLADQQQVGVSDALAAAQERVDALRTDIDDLGRAIDQLGEDGDAALLQAERDAKLRQFGTAFDALEQLEDAPPPRSGYVTLELAIPELAEATNAGFGAPRSRPARAGIGAALGLLLGIALVLVLERVDPRLRTRTATEEAFQLPVLAAVPILGRKERTGIVTVTSPGSVAAEAFRSVRSGVQLMGLHVLSEPSVPGGTVERSDASTGSTGEPRVILVTSAAPGEGKSTTAANLAAAFAETGKSVLVLGCDFRRPEVHKFFDVSATVGLSDVLAGGPTAPALADVVKPTKVKGVRIVTNGNPLKNFGDVAATGRQLVADARALADVVIVDTAPLLATNDAVELIPAVDTVVLVCRAGQTTSDAAKRARELIARLSAPVAGVVLVGAPREGSTYGGYYGGYYSSGPGESATEPVAETPREAAPTPRNVTAVVPGGTDHPAPAWEDTVDWDDLDALTRPEGFGPGEDEPSLQDSGADGTEHRGSAS